MREVFFYNGDVQANQPNSGYSAGTDTVLLASSLKAKNGDAILELGTGSGAALLMANAKLSNCYFTGLESSADMLALAKVNTAAQDNIKIIEGDVGAVPKRWHLKFDQVFANPPYFDEASAVRMSKDKAPAFVAGGAKLQHWIAAMLITLRPRGTGTLIYRADGLEWILANIAGLAGDIRMLPVHSFKDEPAKRVIVQFRKGVKSKSSILPALVLHERGSSEKFTRQAEDIIKGKAAVIL